jgi:hypothetical protein
MTTPFRNAPATLQTCPLPRPAAAVQKVGAPASARFNFRTFLGAWLRNGLLTLKRRESLSENVAAGILACRRGRQLAARKNRPFVETLAFPHDFPDGDAVPPGWKPRLYVSQDGRRYLSQTGSERRAPLSLGRSRGHEAQIKTGNPLPGIQPESPHVVADEGSPGSRLDTLEGARASARFNFRAFLGSRMPKALLTLKRRERRAPGTADVTANDAKYTNKFSPNLFSRDSRFNQCRHQNVTSTTLKPNRVLQKWPAKKHSDPIRRMN